LKEKKNSNGKPYELGDVTTVNLTMLSGGVQYNVLPDRLEAGIDIRISPSFSLNSMREKLNSWCSGEHGLSWEFVQETDVNYTTSLEDNPWWEALQETAKECDVSLNPQIFPASTDSRYVRKAKIPALGISPMRRTPILLHCHDEYLEESVYLEGLHFYAKLIPKLDQVCHSSSEAPSSWVMQCN
jgi:aminoacylase